MTRRVARIALALGVVVGLTSCNDDTPIVPSPKRNLSVSGTGSGRVVSSPAGIDCRINNGATEGPACSFAFEDKQTVTLTATAADDQLFREWRDGCSGTTCQIRLEANASVSVAFVRRVESRTLQLTTPAGDDGAVIIGITGAPITAVTGTSGLQVARRTRTSDGKTFLLIRGQLTSGAVATLSISGLDSDKTLTATVEQVSARQSGNYAQRTNLSAYGATINQ
jgi:hypothetical protein